MRKKWDLIEDQKKNEIELGLFETFSNSNERIVTACAQAQAAVYLLYAGNVFFNDKLSHLASLIKSGNTPSVRACFEILKFIIEECNPSLIRDRSVDFVRIIFQGFLHPEL